MEAKQLRPGHTLLWTDPGGTFTKVIRLVERPDLSVEAFATIGDAGDQHRCLLDDLQFIKTNSVVEMSTGHMRKEDDDRLRASIRRNDRGERDNSALPMLAENDYGWMVWIDQSSEEEAKVGGMSKEFRAVIRFAQKLNFDWVRFDRDGDHIDGLPVFDW